ncbi:MAG TPA: oligosaccharide flippase family protein [Pirellulaceae bacterium]|nr:oligosaccharide flippase family protein [Pirellulaceae bacterium]
MSTAVPTQAAVRGDSLMASVAFMLVMNVVQRSVGFVRGLLFCRVLAPDEIGQWSLAQSFLLFAAPMVVLGLPGTFGRYVAYYRQRRQLRAFLLRMTWITLGLTGVGVLAMTFCESWLAEAMLGDRSALRLMSYSLAALSIVVAFNYLNELLTSLRQIRAVSWMQFINSLVFTVAGISLVLLWEASATAIVLAFAISSLAGMLAVLPWYREIVAEFHADHEALRTGELWERLLPFAGWIWFTNLLTNVADLVDRFMIMHLSGLDSHAAQELVGQYHTSRVVPMLLATMAVTICSIALPHLSHLWEVGRKAEVSLQTNFTFKLIGVSFTAASLGVLWLSPLLFNVILGGKYNSGLEALPWALVSCVWFSLYAVSQNYLWCAEQARLGTIALLLSIGLNMLFNLVAIPQGLVAIMIARSFAILAPILLMLWFSRRHEMKLSRGLWVAGAVPLLIVVGPALGSVLLILVIVVDWRTHWLFDSAEEPQLRAVADKIAAKLGLG